LTAALLAVAAITGLTAGRLQPMYASLASSAEALACAESSTCDQGPNNPPGAKIRDLDEYAPDWGVYCEGAPTREKETVTTPSFDGQSLRCALTGGQPYSNAHFYRNLSPEPTASAFTLTLSFYFTPTTTCNNQAGTSAVQAIEFTTSKWHRSYRHEFALQWQNVGGGAPQWRYWDPHATDQWVAFSPPITQCLGGQTWHTLTLAGAIADGHAHYMGFTIDGEQHPLDIDVAPIHTPGETDRLAVAIQLDGNAFQTPYDVIVDQVSLVREPGDRVYLPIMVR
jgi:hypothetical protein